MYRSAFAKAFSSAPWTGAYQYVVVIASFELKHKFMDLRGYSAAVQKLNYMFVIQQPQNCVFFNFLMLVIVESEFSIKRDRKKGLAVFPFSVTHI